jgi:hypothetical protein
MAWAQYPGLISKKDKATPELRSVAVLEWIGEPGKPSASRLVPVAVYDNGQLNDGTLYLNRPEPLAVTGGVEYELQTDGKPIGIFDVYGSGEIKGSWLGFGAWKPLSAAETTKANDAFNTSQLNGAFGDGNSEEDDKPVLKRKHPKGTDTDDASGGKSSNAGADSGAANGSGIGSGSGAGSGTMPGAASSDPDRPVLKKKSSDDAASNRSGSDSGGAASQTASDPDRPTIRRKRHAEESDGMQASNLPPDPDRPRLKHGKPDSLATTESPRLSGYPPSLQQAVAVSDASNRAEHPWKYTWANPDDETKFKVSLEAMARTALGMDAPRTNAKSKARTTTTRKAAPTPLAPPPPTPLADEQFRVFELAYGSSATMVLTASSPAPPDAAESDEQAPPVIKRGKPTQTSSQSTGDGIPPKPPPQKFVTLIAQPDLYGGIAVLYKSVTDSTHLDETPRMRLVDAVDALGDNRGELLFELRGDQQRQFAMYRVMRGSAEQLFATVAIP